MHICTMFDHRYLPRGMVLYESLMQYAPDSNLYVLCLSDECLECLAALRLPQVVPVSLAELERGDAALAVARADRSLVEYYFTLSPCLPLHLLRAHGMPSLLQVDADGAFFSNPEVIEPLLEGYSIGITGHRFPADMLAGERFGKYNVGFQWFRNDAEGLCCLEWWRAQCLEWCHDRLEADKYADQRYLDQWPELFNAVEIPHKGVNVAPWNFSTFPVGQKEDTVYIGSDPLCYLHFHGVKHLLGSWWLHGAGMYKKSLPRALHPLYQQYIRRLKEAEQYCGITNESITLTRMGERKSLFSYIKQYRAIVTGAAIHVPYLQNKYI